MVRLFSEIAFHDGTTFLGGEGGRDLHVPHVETNDQIMSRGREKYKYIFQ